MVVFKGADRICDQHIQINTTAGCRNIRATRALKGQKLIGQITGFAGGLQELSAPSLRGFRVWGCGDRFGQRQNTCHRIAQLMGRIRDEFVF